MQLPGCHRIGIVASALWLLTAVGGYFYELVGHPSALALVLPHASYEWVSDLDATAKAHVEAKAQGKDFSNHFTLLKPTFNAVGFAILVFAPLVTVWLLVYLLSATVHWVRKGFEV